MIDFTGEKDVNGKPVVMLLSKGGSYSDVDWGIVRLHFEIGAGKDNFTWGTKL